MLARLAKTYLALFREYPSLAAFAVITGTGQIAFALLNIYALPVYLVHDLHLSGLVLGVASATFLLSETLLKFPMGRLSDRLGRRPFVVLGPLVVCLNPAILISLPARLWALVFPLRIADGTGAAALWPPLFAAVADQVRDRSRAAVMSVMNSVYIAAIGAAAAIGIFAAHLSGSHRVPFYVASALLFASGVVAYFWFPRSSALARAHPQSARMQSPGDAERTAEAEPRRIAVPSVAPALLISLLMSSGVLVLSNFLILYLSMDMGFSASQFGLLLVGLAVPVVLLGLPLGHAADRWGTRKAVRLSLAVSGLVMWVIPSCHTVVTFSAAAVVLVASHILGTPAWLAVVSQLAPTARRGGTMGLVATAEGVGAVLGPLLGGWLWDLHHPWIFYGSAVLLTVAAIVAFSAMPGIPWAGGEWLGRPSADCHPGHQR